MNNQFKQKNGSGHLCCKGCGRQDKQLNTFDWLADIPADNDGQDIVEVQFKNTRKGFYRNSNKLKLCKGDIVAVEASPGHDIGTVTLTGRLVPLQMKKANLKPDTEIKRIYRKAKNVDMEKFQEAKAREARIREGSDKCIRRKRWMNSPKTDQAVPKYYFLPCHARHLL